MRYLLDTNIVSELRKGDRADAGLRKWFSTVEADDLALSVLVVAEIRLGIQRLRRRDVEAADHLAAWLARLERAYAGKLLTIDTEVGKAWADLNAPRPLPVLDSLQAATARVYGLTFVTRKLQDLEGIAVPMLNPFTG
ncbi:MAG: type II toxin-antitoxin system VapC family toxin [Thermoanaerobaculia bacterium]